MASAREFVEQRRRDFEIAVAAAAESYIRFVVAMEVRAPGYFQAVFARDAQVSVCVGAFVIGMKDLYRLQTHITHGGDQLFLFCRVFLAETNRMCERRDSTAIANALDAFGK